MEDQLPTHGDFADMRMFSLWFPSWQVTFSFMVSAVARNVFLWFPSWQGTFFYGFRRGRERFFMVSVVGILMVSVVARNVFLMVSVVFLFLNGFRLLQDRGCLSDGNRKKPPERFQDELSIYIYIYMYVCVYVYVYLYMYIMPAT